MASPFLCRPGPRLPTFELNIIGSNGWSRQDVHALLALVKAKKLIPAPHPRRFPLAEGREAMRVGPKRRGPATRLVLCG